MGTICIHGFVSGKVQGVFYRREACTQAKSQNLTGWVKNIDNGRVEVMICGEEAKVLKMQEWLWKGPSAAKIENVQIEKLPGQDFSGFEIRY